MGGTVPPTIGGGGGGVALENLMRGSLSQYMGVAWGFKRLSKSTCEGVHLIVKLPAKSLCKPANLLKMNFTHIFSRILARF